MQTIAVIITLLAIGYGFGRAGVLGALTGLVGAVGVGSGLAIALAERGTAVAGSGSMRTAQRIGGLLAAIGCAIGVFYGGWHSGWMWGVGGYLGGAGSAILLGAIMALTATRAHAPRDHRSGHKPASGDPVDFPLRFDLNDGAHVALIDDIRQRYGALLSDGQHPYAACMYRPAATLPYPKPVIRRALTALLDFVEGRSDSLLIDGGMRTSESADTIHATLRDLDDFVDVPAAQLPTDPVQNARVGRQLQNASDDR